jgi:ATP-dependent Zn protease
MARLVFPVWFSFLLIKFAFRIGRKKKRDKIFGGAKLESISARDSRITFDDIAGIDQVGIGLRPTCARASRLD